MNHTGCLEFRQRFLEHGSEPKVLGPDLFFFFLQIDPDLESARGGGFHPKLGSLIDYTRMNYTSLPRNLFPVRSPESEPWITGS